MRDERESDMQLPELKPGPHSLGEPSRPLMTSDGLTFAWCYKKDEAAELARRSNLFPKLVAALSNAKEALNDDAEMLDRAECKEDAKCAREEAKEIDRILAEIRQSEQEGGDRGD